MNCFALLCFALSSLLLIIAVDLSHFKFRNFDQSLPIQNTETPKYRNTKILKLEIIKLEFEEIRLFFQSMKMKLIYNQNIHINRLLTTKCSAWRS